MRWSSEAGAAQRSDMQTHVGTAMLLRCDAAHTVMMDMHAALLTRLDALEVMLLW